MKLQLSVDLLSLEQAMNLLQNVANFFDILEVGTSLIKQEGMAAVTAFKKKYPNKLISANMKTIDIGGLEAEMAFRAGADFTTVLGIASDATIAGAIASAQKHKRWVVADLMLIQDLEKRSKDLQALGVNYLTVHCQLDEQSRFLASETIDSLGTLHQATLVPLIATGGINQRTIQQLKSLNVEISTVGAVVYASSFSKEIAAQLRRAIDSNETGP